MFSENKFRHYVDMPWMVHPHFYSKNIRYLKHINLSEFQKRYYTKIYRLHIVEQNRFKVNAVKYTEDLKWFHQLQDEYLMLVDNNIRNFSDLLDYRSEQGMRFTGKVPIRSGQLRQTGSIGIISYGIYGNDLKYTDERLYDEVYSNAAALECKEGSKQEPCETNSEEDHSSKVKSIESMEELPAETISEDNSFYSYADYANCSDEKKLQMVGISGKDDVMTVYEKLSIFFKQIGHKADFDELYEETKCLEDIVKKNAVEDRAKKIARELSECDSYKYLKTSVKAEAFKFDISDASGNLELFISVLDKLGVKLDSDRLYGEYQKVYDENVSRKDVYKKEQEKQWSKGRGR